ncbi:MAG: hypothetical protein MK074_01135 [Phycisphaerales bacterium]|nr:hypothetical protein [Phycisphaerales bacterium]
MRVQCLVLSLVMVGCTTAVKDPALTLADGSGSLTAHRQAMQLLEDVPRDDAAAIDALQGLLYRSGFEVDVRRRGADQLLALDRDRLVRTLRQRLPRVTDKPWLRALCTWIGAQQWTADESLVLQRALLSSWARPWSGGMPEAQRPEYQAISQLRGTSDHVDLVWHELQAHDKASEEGYRNRCWELLHRLGARDRLVEALAAVDPGTSTNPMLLDLHDAARDFGTVPWNREEILWLRKLREPSRRTFWAQAQAACAAMPAPRRATLRIRDLPIAVAAMRHRPDLAGADEQAMRRQIHTRLRGRDHYREEDAYYKHGVDVDDRFGDHMKALSWGDLAAITMAMDAMEIPPVVGHLFDYADRDNADTTTEFGGVMALDSKGRVEVLEFLPRVRHHDLRFNAPQDMFDAGYTGLFHFHFHATTHRNRDHAGPGLGDLTYADNTRANCLVFTFVDENTLNVDWYRHDGVVVDLGCVRRPGTTA